VVTTGPHITTISPMCFDAASHSIPVWERGVMDADGNGIEEGTEIAGREFVLPGVGENTSGVDNDKRRVGCGAAGVGETAGVSTDGNTVEAEVAVGCVMQDKLDAITTTIKPT
jgi:hypothetical protein